MANRPWVIISTDSFPEKTNIYIGLRASKDGPRIDGRAKLCFRKGEDASTDLVVPNADGNGDFIAEVKNGDFRLLNWDLSSSAEQGFDTLVVEVEGQKIARTFRKDAPSTQKKDSATVAPKASSTAGVKQESYKGSRLKIGVEGAVIEGPKFIAILPIQTIGADGKPNFDTVKVFLAKGKKVKFLNKATGTLIPSSTESGCEFVTVANKPFLLAVNFNGQFEVEVDVIYPDVEKKHLYLQYPI